MSVDNTITLTIIGSNSRLFKNYCHELMLSKFNLVLLSYRDIYDYQVLINPIVFSYSKNTNMNKVFLESILCRTKGKFTLISSTAAAVSERTRFYNYPNIKHDSEKLVMKSLLDYYILRVGVLIVNDAEMSAYSGIIKKTTPKMIVEKIYEIYYERNTECVFDLFEQTCVHNSRFKSLHFLLYLIYRKWGYFFYLLRPLDIIWRRIGFKNYGYTLISNTL